LQLQEQEKQVATLRARIALLEGSNIQTQNSVIHKAGADSVDDFSIKNAAAKLERLINRWAADIVRTRPASFNEIRQAALTDSFDGYPPQTSPYPYDATGMQVQSLLRHAMSKTISDGIVNCLLVTDSPETNIQLTRIHEHIFTRNPTVASVWRRQTFTAAVETLSPETCVFFLTEQMPALTKILLPGDAKHSHSAAFDILKAGYEFSRMLHSAPSSSGGTVDAFYRAFVPELGGMLNPKQHELVKWCARGEQREIDRVGATVFLGLVKVTHGTQGSVIPEQTVVRRAQVICECALEASAGITPQQQQPVQ